MLIECKENEKSKILDYIGKDYGKCLYIFIDANMVWIMKTLMHGFNIMINLK